ncbi:LamG-like jellyroll fold domain-containing protein [Fodinicola acaciae]|uniref:LamG-like jellyroll fold domain-containing protein n=1 Tax=Fodinicola acaciae TaxID=2681555 RepID=UPI0013D87569|nr:LamG-like jellyroll fold domain-containing protein [Fodinicola acaciae]
MTRVCTVLAAIAVLLTTMISPASGQPTPPRTQRPDEVARINDALNSGTDQWGEQLMKAPNGPSLAAVRDLLPPAATAGPAHTNSGYYYLPFTYPKPTASTYLATRAFALHVADGSEILSNWAKNHGPNQSVTFGVGAEGSESYGSVQSRLADPTLAGGYLPILVNSYTDATGTRYDRESFSTRVGSTTGPLVSYLKYTIHPGSGSSRLRVTVSNSDVGNITASNNTLSYNGRSYVKYSGSASWSSPNLTFSPGATEIYVVVANNPADLSSVGVDAAGYAAARQQIVSYWQGVLAGGATIDIPETYAADAMRNLMLQNLVMGYQQSIGTYYESTDDTFAFIPEVDSTISMIGAFGYNTDYRQQLQELLGRGQGATVFPNWEKGLKLQEAAEYYFRTNDASFINQNLATYTDWLDNGSIGFAAQRARDANGLLEKEQYGSDIVVPVYGVHHQAEAWRGMRDFAVALRKIGNTSLADQFAAQASGLRSAILAAVSRSSVKLADGSLFVPISLLDPAASKPYDPITGTRDGSYWNLTIGYVLGTGIFPPGSPEANGIKKYVERHGGLFLGLTRFNLYGIDPGGCESDAPLNFPDASTPGYKSSGVDQQYGYAWGKFLSDQGEADRLNVQFYGKLGQDLTPNTFIGGEGTTIAPCPSLGEYYRSQYFPPLSANNATYLQNLRALLVSENLLGDGTPDSLEIAPATPRGWLTSGKSIAATNLPTAFGPVSYQIDSQLSQGSITATVSAPPAAAGRFAPSHTILHLRAPAGYRLSSVTVGGTSHDFDAAGETVDLGAFTGVATIMAHYDTVAVTQSDQARPTVLSAGRGVVQRGQDLTVTGTVEAIGAGTVGGSVKIAAPTGWTVPAASGFSVASNGKFGWQPVSFTVRPPTSAAIGNYTLTVTTTPSNGSPVSRKLTVQVATVSALAYADLIAQDRATAYWRLGDSGTAVDSSPYHANGTYQAGSVTGQAGAIAGDSDGSVCLNGNGFVEVPNALSVSPSGPFSAEAWINVDTSQQQAIVEKYDAPAYRGFGLRLTTGNKLQAFLLNDGAAPPLVTGHTSVQYGQWHHAALTYDGVTLVVYLDGKAEAELALPKPTLGSSTLKIGARGDDANTRFHGCVDEVALYDHALTGPQVQAHYLRGLMVSTGGSQKAGQRR